MLSISTADTPSFFWSQESSPADCHRQPHLLFPSPKSTRHTFQATLPLFPPIARIKTRSTISSGWDKPLKNEATSRTHTCFHLINIEMPAILITTHLMSLTSKKVTTALSLFSYYPFCLKSEPQFFGKYKQKMKVTLTFILPLKTGGDLEHQVTVIASATVAFFFLKADFSVSWWRVLLTNKETSWNTFPSPSYWFKSSLAIIKNLTLHSLPEQPETHKEKEWFCAQECASQALDKPQSNRAGHFSPNSIGRISSLRHWTSASCQSPQMSERLENIPYVLQVRRSIYLLYQRKGLWWHNHIIFCLPEIGNRSSFHKDASCRTVLQN